MRVSWRSILQIVRGLRRNRGFSLAVVGCLALVLTANASVLTILNAVVLRPLPYPQADELLHLGLGNGSIANLPVPGSEYIQWLQANRSLAASATYRQLRAVTGNDGDSEDVLGASVSIGFAEVLRIKPLLGRFLNADDERLEEQSAVVLGNRLWINRFGGDLNIVGRSIRLSDRSVTVVGVMPAGFDFPHGSEFWRAEPRPTGAPGQYYTIVARRLSEISVEAVRTDLTRIPRAFTADLPRSMADARPTVEVLRERLYGSAKPAILMLFAGATLLLVIGGAGVANLVLARNASRAPEFALRLALGGTKARIITPIIVECLLLALTAGAIGLLLSVWVSRILVHIGPPILEQVNSIALDWRVVLIMLVWTLLTGGAVGAGAALQATNHGAFEGNALKGRVARTGRLFSFVRRALVITQIAIAMLLMTGAALLATSLANLNNVPLGFEARNVVIASIRLPRERYPTSAGARDFFEALREDLVNTPGVLSVTYGTPPMNGFDRMATSPVDGSGRSYSIATNAVGPSYFATYRTPISSGRPIGDGDNASGEPVVVINQSAKDLIFPNRSPLGERLTAMTILGQHPRIIGVAVDVPQYDVSVRAQPAAFAALAQVDGRPIELAVRTLGDATTLIATVRRLLNQHDAKLAGRFSLLDDVVSRSVAPRLFTATLAGGFAGLALIIATIGLLGLLSYLATQRAHEMGLRVALGARRKDIILLMLREGMVLGALGLAFGGMLTLALNRLLASLIFEVEAHNPIILLLAATFVGGITFAATLVPALRASTANPMHALTKD